MPEGSSLQLGLGLVRYRHQSERSAEQTGRKPTLWSIANRLAAGASGQGRHDPRRRIR
jgi:hypothetical protein